MAAPDARPLRVLHAEDDTAHAELVLRCLRKFGAMVTVTRVEDGESVLDFVDGRPPYAGAPRPDLILLDLRLPKADGLEVLRRLKARPESAVIPVVVLTTSVRGADVEEAYRLHASSYLAKPTELRALDDLLGEFVRYWAVRNQVADRIVPA